MNQQEFLHNVVHDPKTKSYAGMSVSTSYYSIPNTKDSILIIYSYNLIIGIIRYNEYKEIISILFNNVSYSVTTSKHQQMLLNAVLHIPDELIFTCNIGYHDDMSALSNCVFNNDIPNIRKRFKRDLIINIKTAHHSINDGVLNWLAHESNNIITKRQASTWWNQHQSIAIKNKKTNIKESLKYWRDTIDAIKKALTKLRREKNNPNLMWHDLFGQADDDLIDANIIDYKNTKPISVLHNFNTRRKQYHNLYECENAPCHIDDIDKGRTLGISSPHMSKADINRLKFLREQDNYFKNNERKIIKRNNRNHKHNILKSRISKLRTLKKKWNNATTFAERFYLLSTVDLSTLSGYLECMFSTKSKTEEDFNLRYHRAGSLNKRIIKRCARNKKYYWLQGATNLDFYQSHNALLRYIPHTDRRDGEAVIETSGSVSIKYSTFMGLCKRYLNEPAKIVGKNVSAFKVNSYNEQTKMLTIGCHTISIETIRALYDKLVLDKVGD